MPTQQRPRLPLCEPCQCCLRPALITAVAPGAPREDPPRLPGQKGPSSPSFNNVPNYSLPYYLSLPHFPPVSPRNLDVGKARAGTDRTPVLLNHVGPGSGMSSLSITTEWPWVHAEGPQRLLEWPPCSCSGPGPEPQQDLVHTGEQGEIHPGSTLGPRRPGLSDSLLWGARWQEEDEKEVAISASALAEVHEALVSFCEKGAMPSSQRGCKH